MNWLLGLVLILQAGFYWLFKPIINLSSQLIELRWIGFALFLIIIWLISGGKNLDA
tara:strand:- start:708 stop:875 length:168 start_codon:yes stop_codon:yes gene_type:complete